MKIIAGLAVMQQKNGATTLIGPFSAEALGIKVIERPRMREPADEYQFYSLKL